MSLAYYMDVHVPMAITMRLRRCGITVLMSQDDGMHEAEDDELLARATELNHVMKSQDEDLLRIADRWQREKRHFQGLVFSHQQSIMTNA